MHSCSATGLQDKLKRKASFNKPFSPQYDIMFFQEAHITSDIKNNWYKEWLSQITYHGENNARGTMKAFNPKLHPIAHNTIVDDQGRSIYP